MQVNMRREQRRYVSAAYSICWQDRAGQMNSAQVQSLDLSDSGIKIRCSAELPLGASVFIESPDSRSTGYSTVRHCARLDGKYSIGLEFNEDAKKTMAAPTLGSDIDYYEFLQISPKAEFPTIQRIYRFLASRFHPDNPETADSEKFLLLNRAYKILSDPDSRAEYDAGRETQEVRQTPIFETSEFVNGIDGEVNRRLGVLSMLYNKRRSNSENPRVSLFDLEKRMGWPREYLNFTTWYLRSKQYITQEDNSDFTLTALGVDYVESNYAQIPMLHKLLNSGAPTATSSGPSRSNRAPNPQRALGESQAKNV
jgi:curved DNA-binding protein